MPLGSSILFPVLMASLFGSSPIKSDEEVLFFPTAGRTVQEGARWELEVHGWIFEPLEEGARAALLRQIAGALEIEGLETGACTLFPERARYFLVDNERGKGIPVRFSETIHPLEDSLPNGHFIGRLPMSVETVASLRRPSPDGASILFSALTRRGDLRSFNGRVQLIDPIGISVISDIDDTIKITEVRDKKAMLLNTFCRPFRAVPGMAEVYRAWAAKGVRFHYVSGSPWQLYPHLERFREDGGFPEGTFDLKYFRLKDETVLNLITPSDEHKLAAIGKLAERFPGRKLVLVGDSGERDPEIYAEAARRHPQQVVKILIHDVTDEPRGAVRYQEVFGALPAGLWDVFTDAASIRETFPGGS